MKSVHILLIIFSLANQSETLYLSKVLGKPFLGATLVDLRLDTSHKTGSIELRTKTNGLPRYKYIFIDITLSKNKNGLYEVSGFPDGFLKPQQKVYLKVNIKNSRNVELILSNPGDMRSSVILEEAVYPEEGVTIPSDKSRPGD